MCGIVAVFNVENGVQKVLSGLTCIEHRGGDGAGLCTEKECVKTLTLSELPEKAKDLTGNSVLGHVLHSTVGHVLEPFVGDVRFVMNGEIFNWEAIDAHYGNTSENDAHAFFQAWEKAGVACLDEMDGDFAFVAWDDLGVTFGRDLIGIKPLWYYHSGKELMLASERKSLMKLGVALDDIYEVLPHMMYEFKEGDLQITEREFFNVTEEDRPKEEMIEALYELLKDSISKRSKPRVGVLFSGGIDSVTIAYVAKQLGFEVYLYTAAFEDGNTKMSEDLQWARRAAEWLDLPLNESIVSLEETQKAVPIIVEAIEEADAIKVGVALPFYFCGKEAKKNDLLILLSGLGSEEIFAGYERHAQSEDYNAECLKGLKGIHARDLYRDDVVMLKNTVAARVPFLDGALIEYAMSIPSSYKIVDGVKKVILREMAESIGISKEFAWRKKKAAQYGSNFDKALAKLAKKNGFEKKKEYLQSVMAQ